MIRHSHKFTIADEDAVRVLVEKIMKGTKRQQREQLFRAGADATRHYKDSSEKARRAFFQRPPLVVKRKTSHVASLHHAPADRLSIWKLASAWASSSNV